MITLLTYFTFNINDDEDSDDIVCAFQLCEFVSAFKKQLKLHHFTVSCVYRIHDVSHSTNRQAPLNLQT